MPADLDRLILGPGRNPTGTTCGEPSRPTVAKRPSRCPRRYSTSFSVNAPIANLSENPEVVAVTLELRGVVAAGGLLSQGGGLVQIVRERKVLSQADQPSVTPLGSLRRRLMASDASSRSLCYWSPGGMSAYASASVGSARARSRLSSAESRSRARWHHRRTSGPNPRATTAATAPRTAADRAPHGEAEAARRSRGGATKPRRLASSRSRPGAVDARAVRCQSTSPAQAPPRRPDSGRHVRLWRRRARLRRSTGRWRSRRRSAA
jgi:hypothetical protein